MNARLWGPRVRHIVAFVVVVVLSLLMTRAFGVHRPGHCEPGDRFGPGDRTGYGYGYSPGFGYGYGYGPCPPTPAPTAAPTPVVTPSPSPQGTPTPTQTVSGTITLLNSRGVPTTQFIVGENGTAVLDGLERNTRYDIDFAQSPGVIIGSGTTNAVGDQSIAFRIPTTATIGSARLTFLPNGSTTNSRVIPISIVAGAVTTATPGPTLPTTGAQILAFLVTAFALVALGTTLTLSTRRPLAVPNDGGLPLWFAGRRSPEDLRRGLAASSFGRRRL